MLYKRFLTVSLLFAMFGVQANVEEVKSDVGTAHSELKVRFASRLSINKHGKDIAQMLKTRYWSQMGLQAVSGTAILWMVYSYVTGYKIVSADQFHTSEKINALLMQKLPKLAEEIQNAVQNGNCTKPDAGSWFDTIANGGKTLGLYMLLAKANSIVTKLFDDPSVKWFTLEKTGLDDIHKEIMDLKVDMKLLQTKQIVIGSQRVKHYAGHIVSLYNSLVANVEKVIAYITYSIDELKLSHNKSLDDELCDRLKETSDQLHELTEQYAATDDNMKRVEYILKMFTIVELLDAEVRSSLQGFARLEGEVRNR